MLVCVHETVVVCAPFQRIDLLDGERDETVVELDVALEDVGAKAKYTLKPIRQYKRKRRKGARQKRVD